MYSFAYLALSIILALAAQMAWKKNDELVFVFSLMCIIFGLRSSAEVIAEAIRSIKK